MATPFEGLSLMDNFSFVFPFLLVLVVIWGLLNWVKLFGENKTVNGMIAVVFAMMTLFSPIVRETINVMSPWFVLLFFFIIFALVAFKIFGFGDADIMGVMSGGHKFISFWVVALVIIIAFGSLFYVLANQGGVGTGGDGDVQVTESDGSVSSGSQQNSFWATMVHPKVLGFILIMLIAMFTVQRLAAA